jgi:hypothetical protein
MNKRYDYCCKHCWHTWRHINKYLNCTEWSLDELNDKCVINAKQAGYIKKDPVEEAEEMYQNRMSNEVDWMDLADKQHDAIKYLKERQK